MSVCEYVSVCLCTCVCVHMCMSMCQYMCNSRQRNSWVKTQRLAMCLED